MKGPGTALSVIFEVVRFLSVASLGLFAGAMLTEGCVLVPYWRSLRPAEFLSWYSGQGHRLQGFFGPLTYVAGLLALAAAFVSLWEGHPSRTLTSLAAVLMVAAVATFFVYFGRANTSFARASLPTEEVATELARWAKWHWLRTSLSFLALAAAMMASWRHE